MTAKATLTKKLIDIQQELEAPKNLHNKFGGYNYRSCEGILEAVKPHLKKHHLILTMSDDIISIGEYAFVKATVTLSDGENEFVVSACARDAITKTKSDAAQITGAASSYARKYALNGLFAIDDTKDADATNKHKGANDRKSDDDKLSPELKETVGNGPDFTLEPDQVSNTVINYFGNKTDARDFILDAGFPMPSDCDASELRGILDALKKYSKNQEKK